MSIESLREMYSHDENSTENWNVFIQRKYHKDFSLHVGYLLKRQSNVYSQNISEIANNPELSQWRASYSRVVTKLKIGSVTFSLAEVKKSCLSVCAEMFNLPKIQRN